MQDAQVAAWGLTAADYESTAVELWPENAPAWNVMGVMYRQWRCGASGPIGLDYNVLPFALEQVGVPKRHRRRVFEDIQVMEDEALKTIYEAKEDA